MEHYVTGMLRKVEQFVKNECGDVENGILERPEFRAYEYAAYTRGSGGSRSQRISISPCRVGNLTLTYFRVVRDSPKTLPRDFGCFEL
jgi:hypothetical protein